MLAGPDLTQPDAAGHEYLRYGVGESAHVF
jgi:hypothetical protein